MSESDIRKRAGEPVPYPGDEHAIMRLYTLATEQHAALNAALDLLDSARKQKARLVEAGNDLADAREHDLRWFHSTGVVARYGGPTTADEMVERDSLVSAFRTTVREVEATDAE